MSRIQTVCLTAMFLAAIITGQASGGEKDHSGHEHHTQQPADHADAQATSRIGDPYPFATDPVTGVSLLEIDEPVTLLHEERELRFADAKSAATFKADPEKYLTKVDEQIIESQIPYYPMTTCPISGDEFGGEMGEPVDYVYGNRLIRFCCKGCKGDFLKNPSATLEKLDAVAIALQVEHYPLETCPISGQKLGSMGEPRDVVIANRLVRLCCPGCKIKLITNAAKMLAQVDAAWKASGVKPGANHTEQHGGHDADKHGQEERHGHDAHAKQR